MNAPVIDEMFLLGSTPQGRHALRDLPPLVAGAALIDLASRRRLDHRGRAVHMIDATPTGHPVLDDLLAQIAASRRARAPWHWVFDLARPAIRGERQHLVNSGVLGSEEQVVLGMVPRTQHPVVALDTRQQIVDRVRAVVLADDVLAAFGRADVNTRALVSLLGAAYHSRRTAAALFPEIDARTLRSRLKRVAADHWAVHGTAQAVRITNAARA